MGGHGHISYLPHNSLIPSSSILEGISPRASLSVYTMAVSAFKGEKVKGLGELTPSEVGQNPD